MPTVQPDRIAEVIGVADGESSPGCAVAVFREGGPTFAFGGLANIAAGRRANADTLYYAGSLAKQFTALAVVQLVAAGRLELQADVRRYLPEMPLRSPAITVEMLLHHTSGLPNYAKLAPLAGYQRAGDLNRADTLRMLLAYPGGAYPPGTTFEYSNGGYLLLSEIVERVSGEAFVDYVRRHILDPLGMRRSRVLDGALPDDANRAVGYLPAETGFKVSEDVPTFGGAGAMMFTLDDLGRYFDDITAGQRVWTPEVYRLMTEPGRFADGSPVILPVPSRIFGYAGGLMLSRNWVQHGGNFAGFQAWFGWLPGARLGLAVLCNRGDIDPLQLATRVAAAVAPEAPAPDAPRFSLDGMAGRFVCDPLGAVCEIEDVDGEELQVTLTPPGPAPAAALTFRRSADGVYAGGPLTLLFDPDRRGLQIRNENVTARYRRAS